MRRITKILVILVVVQVVAVIWLFKSNFKDTAYPPVHTSTPLKTTILPIQISREDARQKVQMRTEVQKFIIDHERRGKQAVIDIEDLDEYWNVHIYEIVKTGSSSHTATFGWYRVHKITGEIIMDI